MDLINTEPAKPVLQRLVPTPAEGSDALLFLCGGVQLFPPQRIEWNRVELPISGLPTGLNGVRVLHLSDFHLRAYWPRAMEALLSQIRQDPPDLLLMTGDFVENKRNYLPAMSQVRRLVQGVAGKVGCFAIHGNHDSYKVGVLVRDMGVTFLDGQRTIVDLPGGQVELIGLPGKRRNQLTEKVLKSFPSVQPGVPRIVLSHFPDHLTRTGGLGAALFLAGHTHGGQVCFPGGGMLMWHDSLPRKLAHGVHRVGKTWLVVSRGLGYTGLPVRAFCPPEVLEIVLRVE